VTELLLHGGNRVADALRVQYRALARVHRKIARPNCGGIIGVFLWHLGRALINAQVAAWQLKEAL